MAVIEWRRTQLLMEKKKKKKTVGADSDLPSLLWDIEHTPAGAFTNEANRRELVAAARQARIRLLCGF
jgi:hypothetical protein